MTTRRIRRDPRRGRLSVAASVLACSTLAAGHPGQAQAPDAGEWTHIGADAANTRYSGLEQIRPDNFADLEVAWIWRGDNFSPRPDPLMRSTPVYADGMLFTVVGSRRQVVAIDPGTGETLWSFREPPTERWERSMRQSHGKGVAYGERNGRGVIYVVTPGFFLHALDAETGRPLEDWGTGVPIEGFPGTGTVDLLADLGHPYDVERGIPPETGYITNSSPPIVVNDVIIVGNSHEQGYRQTRIENVPGDILAYDALTGEHKWRFNIIPRPGEYGHETWESDAWSYTGNLSSWAPMSADPERGLVFIPTDPPSNDFWGGFHPGDNLFATSILALDVETGERAWHYQTVHHDIWNYDNPHGPLLLDLVVAGEPVAGLMEASKNGFLYALNRETGEPIWPIPERPVPASPVPGEETSPTQPHPTRPAPFELQGLTEDDLVDFTPELRQEALEYVSDMQLGPIFTPIIHSGNPDGIVATAQCPRFAALTTAPPAADPESGIMYVASRSECRFLFQVPGAELDDPDAPYTTGETVASWVHGGDLPARVQGIPVTKPPYGKITAIDMNTGEHLWWIPNGDTPRDIREHPALRGVDLPRTGKPAHAPLLVTGTLLLHGEGRGGDPLLHAVDKRTGEELATVEVPAPIQYGLMTYLHEGRQHIVLQVGGGGMPGSLVALRLP